MGDAIARGIILAIAAPFWLTYRLIRFLTGSAAATEATQKEANLAPVREQHEQERKGQLAALRQTLPQGAPTKMRAAIAVHELKWPAHEQKRVKRLFGDDRFTLVMTGFETRYAADMVLELTESERAIIKQHSLDDIVLEDEAFFSEDDIHVRQRELATETSAIHNELNRAVAKEVNKTALELMRHERRKTRVGDLLVSPFSRVFADRHAAHLYADALKTKHLPRLRQLIDDYGTHGATQIVEL